MFVHKYVYRCLCTCTYILTYASVCTYVDLQKHTYVRLSLGGDKPGAKDHTRKASFVVSRSKQTFSSQMTVIWHSLFSARVSYIPAKVRTCTFLKHPVNFLLGL